MYLYCGNDPVNSVDPNGLDPRVKHPGGHHVVPQAIFGKAGLSEEAYNYFYHATTGPVEHCYDADHRRYSEAVQKMWDKWLHEQGIDPKKMTKAQAEEFVRLVLHSKEEAIKVYLTKLAKAQGISLKMLRKNVLKNVTAKLEEIAVKTAARQGVKGLGKKALGFLGRRSGILAIALFAYDWYTGGFRHACEELAWPLSELWGGD